MQHLYCNVTFVRQGSLDDDGNVIKLKRCSRCRCTYYIDQQAQRSHWKVHKKVCASLDDSVELQALKRRVMAADTAEAAFEPLRLALEAQEQAARDAGDSSSLCGAPESPAMGFLWLWFLQRWEQLVRSGIETNPNFALLNNVLFQQGNGCWSDLELEKFWAVPGMTTYLLNLDVLPSKLQAFKRDYPEQLPSYALLSFDFFDLPPDPDGFLCPTFQNQIGSILSEAALCMMDDDKGSWCLKDTILRQSPIAWAASRKIMTMLLDRWTFISLAPAIHGVLQPVDAQAGDNQEMTISVRNHHFAHLFYKLVYSPLIDPDHPESFVFGLDYEGAVRVYLYYIVAGAYPDREVRHLAMKFLQNAARDARHWWDFSVERRADFAVEMARDLLVRHGELPSEIEPYCFMVMKLFTCAHGLGHPSLWHDVLEQIIAKHGRDHAVYFQNWLDGVLDEVRPTVREYLGLVSSNAAAVPEEVETLICEFSFEIKELRPPE